MSNQVTPTARQVRAVNRFLRQSLRNEIHDFKAVIPREWMEREDLITLEELRTALQDSAYNWCELKLSMVNSYLVIQASLGYGDYMSSRRSVGSLFVGKNGGYTNFAWSSRLRKLVKHTGSDALRTAWANE